MKHFFILFSVLILLLPSCSSDTLTIEEQFAVDTQIIEDYLSANNLVAEKTIDGVYFIIDEEGSAEKPKLTSSVNVAYAGYFTDKTIFDASENATFKLFQVIQGWQIGIPKFGRGGKGMLLIPSKFAYGTSSQPGRANAVLIFDIEVFDF